MEVINSIRDRRGRSGIAGAAAPAATAARDPKNPASWARSAATRICPCGSGKKYKHVTGATPSFFRNAFFPPNRDPLRRKRHGLGQAAASPARTRCPWPRCPTAVRTANDDRDRAGDDGKGEAGNRRRNARRCRPAASRSPRPAGCRADRRIRNVPRAVSGDSSLRCTGTIPQAPCTVNCIRKAPIASSAGCSKTPTAGSPAGRAAPQ